MRRKSVRPAELFCSIDRTSFVAVSATVFAIFVFALMLTSGLPKFGPADLPKVNNPIMAPDADGDDAVVLVIMYDGRVFWRKDEISTDDLRHEIRHRLERNPQAEVFLAVDAHASYADVSTVLAAVRSAGVERVVFLVDQRKIGAAGIIYPQPGFWDVDRRWRDMDLLGRVDFVRLAVNPVLSFVTLRCRSARANSMK